VLVCNSLYNTKNIISKYQIVFLRKKIILIHFGNCEIHISNLVEEYSTLLVWRLRDHLVFRQIQITGMVVKISLCDQPRGLVVGVSDY